MYTGEGLQVRTEKRKTLQRPRLPMELLSAVNQHWSMDVVSDQPANGCSLPPMSVCNGGPAFTGKAMSFRAKAQQASQTAQCLGLSAASGICKTSGLK